MGVFHQKVAIPSQSHQNNLTVHQSNLWLQVRLLMVTGRFSQKTFCTSLLAQVLDRLNQS